MGRSQAQLTTRAGTGDLWIRATSFNSMNKKVLNYQEKKIFVILEPGSGNTSIQTETWLIT